MILVGRQNKKDPSWLAHSKESKWEKGKYQVSNINISTACNTRKCSPIPNKPKSSLAIYQNTPQLSPSFK